MQKSLGLQLSDMNDDLRKKYKIKDSVKGVVITGVDASFGRRRQAAHRRQHDRRDRAGAGGEPRPTCRSKVDALKKAGKKTALLLVATAEGDMLFVALSRSSERGDSANAKGGRRAALLFDRVDQSSTWLTMPSASFGSNQVDFGGMISPASATAIRSAICVG